MGSHLLVELFLIGGILKKKGNSRKTQSIGGKPRMKTDKEVR